MSIVSLFTCPFSLLAKPLTYTAPALFASLYLGVAGVAMAADEVVIDANSPATTAPCATQFFNVAVIDSARQCQRFSETLPASLVYFTPQNQAQTLTFYQQQHPDMTTHKTVNQRTLLSKDGGRIKVIISPDKQGSQVDILVVNNN